MHDHAKKVARKVAGVLCIIGGVLGAFVPIPLVPFFILIFIGLALLDVQHPLIDKAREWYRARREKKLTKSEIVLAGLGSVVTLGVLAVAALFSYTFFLGERYLYSDISETPRADTAIVLGASVRGNQMSPVLYKRAEAAAKLYAAGKVSNILVTGDGTSNDYDEVTPVRRYLESVGVPASDIRTDSEGIDTYTSLHRAHYAFAVSSAVIVTQHFHLGRSLLIGRSLGMDARGFAASERDWLSYNQAREFPATLKAAFDLMIGRNSAS